MRPEAINCRSCDRLPPEPRWSGGAGSARARHEEEEVILEITRDRQPSRRLDRAQISEVTTALGVTLDGRSERGVVGQTQELGVSLSPHARDSCIGEVENRSLNRRIGIPFRTVTSTDGSGARWIRIPGRGRGPGDRYVDRAFPVCRLPNVRRRSSESLRRPALRTELQHGLRLERQRLVTDGVHAGCWCRRRPLRSRFEIARRRFESRVAACERLFPPGGTRGWRSRRVRSWERVCVSPLSRRVEAQIPGIGRASAASPRGGA